MKKYLKKFSIMFAMLLTIIGIGMVQNESVAKAVTVGDQLITPEDGWQRIDERNNKIIYTGDWEQGSATGWWESTSTCTATASDAEIKIKFFGTKFRLIGATNNTSIRNGSTAVSVVVDNREPVNANFNSAYMLQNIMCDINDLPSGVHTVTIKGINEGYIWVDAIDIDKSGYLIPYDEALDIDKSSLGLTVNGIGQLTATTTPASVGVVWTSSDSSIATVDSNGKVTAGSITGTCTITATTDDEYKISDSCTVNVTTATEPTDTTSDGSLYIELVDGNIKSYDVTSAEITDFIEWYESRDKDDSELPYYKFNKGDYKDYVIHDQIDWFEVR